jgi:hypothetical protein
VVANDWPILHQEGIFHAGAVGSETHPTTSGFSGSEIKWGAGWAENHDPAHIVGNDEYSEPYNGVEDYSSPDSDDWNWGDEKLDNNAVSFGIKLWKKYQDNLTLAQFKSELSGAIGGFSKCKPLLEDVDGKTASKWPYSVGEFNNKGNVYKLPEGSCQ